MPVELRGCLPRVCVPLSPRTNFSSADSSSGPVFATSSIASRKSRFEYVLAIGDPLQWTVEPMTVVRADKLECRDQAGTPGVQRQPLSFFLKSSKKSGVQIQWQQGQRRLGHCGRYLKECRQAETYTLPKAHAHDQAFAAVLEGSENSLRLEPW